MILTLTGICCILLTIALFVQNRKKALLDPRLLILFLYFSNWGRIYDLEYNLHNDFLLLCSFLIFYGIVTLLYKKRLVFNEKLAAMLPLKSEETSKPLPSKAVLFLYVFAVVCITITILYYTEIYGDFELAFVRFYAHFPEVETKGVYGILLTFMLLFSILGLTLIHYSNRKFGKSNPPFYYVCLAGVILIAFSGGSRGWVLVPIMLILVSQVFIAVKENSSLIKSVVKIPLIFFLLFSLILALFLTENRNHSYDDVTEMLEDLVDGQYLFTAMKNQDSGIAYEKDLMMHDYYLVMETFPDNLGYYPLLSSVYTVLVNPVPRFLWPQKPVGFGRKLAAIKVDYDSTDPDIATELLTSFAAGIHGEGYANGGIPGMFFYTVLLGVISGILANLYKVVFQYDGLLSFILSLLLLPLPGCYVRGDILSGFSHSIIPVCAIIFCLIIFRKIYDRKRTRYTISTLEHGSSI